MKKIKILLITPSNLKTVPMGGFVLKALENLGHTVSVEVYNESMWEKFISTINNIIGRKEIYLGANKRIRNRILRFKPNLLFAIYGIHISKETLSYAKKMNIKTACWWLNDPFQFERGLKLAKNYDYWFSNSKKCAKIVQSKFKIKSQFLPTAYDPETHKKIRKNKIFSCDICFAGDWSESREKLLSFLISKGFDLKIYGPWEKKLNKNSPLFSYLIPGFFTPKQMAEYFSNAKIILNHHTWFKKFSHGVNPRLFEAAGCETVQVVDFKTEIPDLFFINKEIITYANISQLPIILNSLLNDSNKRQKIAFKAKARVLRDHTYEKRMCQMLSFIFPRAKNK
jgi:spore maturation protein CgeB